ncbi:MAG: PD-(D/E)XK motif protein [Sutterella parvirubra]|nr:PD-(D/E)XK motif protein [Sutterella parvirubra]MDY5200771.1 PD-(D/E)XK motif protein [Sutterella parvirubra]
MTATNTRARLDALWKDTLPGSWLLYRKKPVEARLCKSRTGSRGVEFVLTAPPAVPLKSADGFAAEIVEEDGRSVLRILNTATVEPGLFETFVSDLIDLVGGLLEKGPISPEAACMTLVHRIDAWLEFMHHRQEGMSKAQEIGLFGELSVLLDWLEKGGSGQRIYEVWTGPKRTARDFRFSDTLALEVKTSAKKPLTANIDSLDQLDTAEYADLHVIGILLEESDGPEGETVLTLRDKIRNLLPTHACREDFESLCLQVKLPKDEPTTTAFRHFKRAKTLCFRAEDLPRLTPGSVEGIVRARYDILLTDDDGNPIASAPEQDYSDLLQMTLHA